MTLPIVLGCVLLVLVLIRAAMSRGGGPVEQDVRVLLKGQRLSGLNLFPCVDCAGYRGSHEPWCGRPRPRDFVDPRRVNDRRRPRG